MDKEQLKKELEKYHPQMNSDQRAKAYFSGERVDYLPFNIMSLDVVYGQQMGYTLTGLYDMDNLVKALREIEEKYQIIGISEGLNLRAMGHAVGSELYFPENDNDRIEKFLMEDELNMDLIELADPYSNKVLAKKLENARKLKDALPLHPFSTKVAGPISTAAAIRPISKLLRDLRKNPDEAKKLIDFCVDANLVWVKAVYEEFGPVNVMIADPVGCDDILSPKQAVEFSLPYLSKLTKGIHEITGFKPNMHMCGHTSRQWESFNDLELAGFSVDNCHDLGECKAAIEDKLTLIGNIPPVEVMRYGSIDEVIEAVRLCIRKGADAKNGYICATGCATPAGTPQENIDAFIYAVSKYGANAKLGEMPEAAFID